MDMNIQKYVAFSKTVEYSSFTKAADILNYTQSGISRMINDLEKGWGVSLLERSRSGVQLTSDGLKLFPLINNFCNEFYNLQMQVEKLNGLQYGLIRIGTFSSVATHWLPNIVKKFQNDYPNIDYEFLLGDYEDIERWILEDYADCGFISLPTHNKLESILLEKDKLFAILPENHPLIDCEYFPIKAFDEYPFIMLEQSEAYILDIFKKYSISPKINFKTLDGYAIMSMVENSLGISILPQLILKRIPFRIVVKELEIPAYRDIGLVFKDRIGMSLATKRFLDYLEYR
ncbi:MAG: LysR family transcriptional regulator [Tissierellia bacterium]|nr:LysR family transcriptional regulator [Tissierellia bacterium]